MSITASPTSRQTATALRARLHAGRAHRRALPPLRGDRPADSRELAESRLASYVDRDGRLREIVSIRGTGAGRLVIDRDQLTLSDQRLIAHLAPDEPAVNADVVCALYMENPEPSRCPHVMTTDLNTAPPSELEGQTGDRQADRTSEPISASSEAQLQDANGNLYRIERVESRMCIPELRWRRHGQQDCRGPETLSVRDTAGALQSYAEVRRITAEAICRYQDDPHLSVVRLSGELERLNESPYVLNRGLREAALQAVAEERVTMSEIALRCGRLKHDSRGGVSGETTWLARRLGLVGERGSCAPTPWIQSDVLALIARRGLGIAPREVEVV